MRAPLDLSDGIRAVPIGPETPLTRTRAILKLNISPTLADKSKQNVAVKKKETPEFLLRKICSALLITGCAQLVISQHAPLLALMKLLAALCPQRAVPVLPDCGIIAEMLIGDFPQGLINPRSSRRVERCIIRQIDEPGNRQHPLLARQHA